MDNYLYILPLIFPLYLIIDYIIEIYSLIKLKNISVLILRILFLLLVISLSILYINKIYNNEYEINIYNIWIKIIILIFIIFDIAIGFFIIKLRKSFKKYLFIILIVVYLILFIILPFIDIIM